MSGNSGMAAVVLKSMKHSAKRIGFVEAVGLAAYIGFFAAFAYRAQQWVHLHRLALHPIWGISLFLLAFVISALVCASIILAYPATLFFEGERMHALKIVLWNAVWLAAIFILVALAAFLFTVGLVFS